MCEIKKDAHMKASFKRLRFERRAISFWEAQLHECSLPTLDHC